MSYEDKTKEELLDRIRFLEQSIDELQKAQGKHEQIEKVLAEGERKYQELVLTITDSIMIFDAKTKQFLEVNNACEQLYGYTKDEFLNLRQDDITVEPEKTASFIDQISDAGGLNIPLRYHKKKDGTVFPVKILESCFEMNGKRICCEVIRDITSKIKVENELILFRKLIDNSNEAVYVCDAVDGGFIDVNLMACKATGFTREELL